uniref:Photosystem I reaction center subunit III n=1 Tax=Mesostigma viride TaxID=41882 RepID=A0A7S4X4Y6_MESVI|eukprot:jgi/Mesvir1/18403/Mv14280-RA.1
MAATTVASVNVSSKVSQMAGTAVKAQKALSFAPLGAIKPTVCSAEKADFGKVAKQAGAALALAAVVSTSTLANPDEVYADVAGLTPCSESAAFTKTKKKEIKKLTQRQKLYEAGSAPYLALQDSIDKTNRRFDFYASQGVLCGADGLPHLIVDGDLNHLGEFVVPGLGFLYVAGWIGWVGRRYLVEVAKSENPTEKEIIIDVPLARTLLMDGAVWPIAAWMDLLNGSLLEKKENITVSPR